jgi:hypothetical protein
MVGNMTKMKIKLHQNVTLWFRAVGLTGYTYCFSQPTVLLPQLPLTSWKNYLTPFSSFSSLTCPFFSSCVNSSETNLNATFPSSLYYNFISQRHNIYWTSLIIMHQQIQHKDLQDHRKTRLQYQL